MSNETEQQYLDALLAGDRDALRLLYDKHLPRIIKYVTQNSGSEEDAYDIFQEAILVIFKKAERDGLRLTASFFTYLYAVCSRMWLQKLKKRKRRGVTFSEPEEYTNTETEGIQEIMEEEERYRLYRAKFRELSENCRRVMSLYFQKVPMEEIAQLMGFASVNYAKKRKYHCKEKLVGLIRADKSFNQHTLNF